MARSPRQPASTSSVAAPVAVGDPAAPAEPVEPVEPVELTRSTFRRRWLITFLLLAAVATAWSVVTPLGGGIDEPAHAIRAASLAGGQLHGEPYPPIGGGARLVDAPATLRGIDPTCFAFRGGYSASCRPSYDGPSGDVPQPTTAGVSPPAYYAFVGPPLRLIRSFEGVYVARLVSGLVVAALAATAVQLAAAARSRFLTAAVMVSWTPMAAALSGVINPSALEVGAGVLVWVSGLLLVRPSPLPAWLEARLIWYFTVASVLFVVSRQISAVILACIVGVLALAAPWPRLRGIAADRRTWIAAGVVTAATAFAGWWLLAHPLAEETNEPATAVGGRHALSTAFGYLGVLYDQMIGIFGWLDAPPPVGVVLAWTVAIGVVVVLGAAVGARRLVAALVAITAVSLLVPNLFHASQMEEYGIVFQGRYILPLAMGVVLIAGRAVDEAGDDLVATLARAGVLVLGLTVVGQLVAIWFAARRFAVGVGGPVLFVREGWSPGIPLAVPLALAFLAVPALTWFAWQSSSPGAVASGTPDRILRRGSARGTADGSSAGAGDADGRDRAGATPAPDAPVPTEAVSAVPAPGDRF
jgi:hypothetical protein